MAEDRISVVLFLEDHERAKRISDYLVDNYGYDVLYPSSESKVFDWNTFSVLGSNGSKSREGAVPKPDIAVIDFAYWNDEDAADSDKSLLAKLKQDYPDIGKLLFTDNAFEKSISARQKGADRFLAGSVRDNDALIGQTIQLIAVDQAIQHIAEDMSRFVPYDILTSLCRHIVRIFDVDHCGLAIFDSSLFEGAAVAEYPSFDDQRTGGKLGDPFPLRGIPIEMALIDHQEEQIIPDIVTDLRLGAVRKVLIASNISSTMLVPIIARNNSVIASFSLDMTTKVNTNTKYTDDVRAMCKRLAKQFAIAVEHYRLQKALGDIARVAEAPIDIKPPLKSKTPLLDRLGDIVRQAVDLLRARRGGLYLFDPNEDVPEKQVLTIVTDFQRQAQLGGFNQVKSLRGMTLKKGEGMAGWLVSESERELDKLPTLPLKLNKRITATNDYLADSRKTEKYSEHEFEAVIEALLVWQNKPIGVLYVEDAAGRKFASEESNPVSTLGNDSGQLLLPQEAEQLLLFANQAAITIAILTQRRQLEIINAVMRKVLDEPDPDEVINIVLAQIATYVDCTHCTYFVNSGQPGDVKMKAVASRGIGTDNILQRGEFSLADKEPGLVYYAYQDGKAKVTGDAKQEFGWARPKTNEDVDRSMILVPVTLSGRKLGVITVDNDKLHAFTHYDLELVEELIRQIEGVLDRSETLRLLTRTSERIISKRQVTDTLREILKNAIELTHATSGGLHLIKEKYTSNTFEKKSDPIWVSTVSDPLSNHHPKPRLENLDGLTQRIIRDPRNDKGEPNIIEKCRDEYTNPDLDKSINFQAVVSLVRIDEVIGVLFVDYTDASKRLTPAEKFSLRSLASLAAVALRNAELFEERESTRTSLKQLFEASETFTSSQNADYILKTAARLIYASTKFGGRDRNIEKTESPKPFEIKLVEIIPTLVDPKAKSELMLGAPYCYPEENPETPLSAESKGKYEALSKAVLSNGKPIKISNINEDHPEWGVLPELATGCKAALCLALAHQGQARRIGVMWIHYERPQEFTIYDIEAFQIYANQAAVAFDNASRIRNLEEGLRGITQSIVDDIRVDHDQIREESKQLFRFVIPFAVFAATTLFIAIWALLWGSIPIAGLNAVAGVLNTSVLIVFYRRIDAASHRMDKYHDEFVAARNFEQLMTAADSLTDSDAQKQAIMKLFGDEWLKRHEVRH